VKILYINTFLFKSLIIVDTEHKIATA